MQDDDGRLVEAIAKALALTRMREDRECGGDEEGIATEVNLRWRNWIVDGRAALSAIEREGFKVVPVERVYDYERGKAIVAVCAYCGVSGAHLAGCQRPTWQLGSLFG